MNGPCAPKRVLFAMFKCSPICNQINFNSLCHPLSNPVYMQLFAGALY